MFLFIRECSSRVQVYGVQVVDALNMKQHVNFSALSQAEKLKSSTSLFSYSFCLQLETALRKNKLLKVLETTLKFRKRMHHIGIKLWSRIVEEWTTGKVPFFL